MGVGELRRTFLKHKKTKGDVANWNLYHLFDPEERNKNQ